MQLANLIDVHLDRRHLSADLDGIGHVLVGHNHQALSPLTGPGYFVAHASTEDTTTGFVLLREDS